MGELLKGAELMAVGTWNGRTFSEADLDGIVSSFDALGLAGRVPLKLGHQGKDARDEHDGFPALGWVTRLYRDGETLKADIADIPAKLYDLIKSAAYKFVSVELLRNVKADTRIIPWVLDAVALLGATQPAVGILGDLQALAMTRGTGLRAGGRIAFRRELNSGGYNAMDEEVERLRRENVALRAERLATTIEADIRSGRVLPCERERFNRKHGASGTVDLWRQWIADVRPPARDRNRPQAFGDAELVPPLDTVEAEAEALGEHLAALKRKQPAGEAFDCRAEVFAFVRKRWRADKAAGERWLSLSGSGHE